MICSISLCKYITVHSFINGFGGIYINCWGRHLFFVFLYMDARISFRVYALSGIPGFIHRPIFNYNKYCEVILHSICSSLCSYQCLKSYYRPVFLSILGVVRQFNFSHSGGWTVLSYCGFLFFWCEELLIFLVTFIAIQISSFASYLFPFSAHFSFGLSFS